MKQLAINGGQPVRREKLYYGHQFIEEDDIKAVENVLRGDYLTCGPYVSGMERSLERYTGVRYAVAVANGTAALHCACIAAGIRPGRLDGVEAADSKFSMKVEEFAKMVRDVRNAKLISAGPDYTLSEGEKASTIFRRSLFAVKEIKKGEIFTSDNIRSIRPGYGEKPKYLKTIIGQICKKNLAQGEPVMDDCFELRKG